MVISTPLQTETKLADSAAACAGRAASFCAAQAVARVNAESTENSEPVMKDEILLQNEIEESVRRELDRRS